MKKITLLILLCINLSTGIAQMLDLVNKRYKITMDVDSCCRLFNGVRYQEDCYCIIVIGNNDCSINVYNKETDNLVFAISGFTKRGAFELTGLLKGFVFQEDWTMTIKDGTDYESIGLTLTGSSTSMSYMFSWLILSKTGKTHIVARKKTD